MKKKALLAILLVATLLLSSCNLIKKDEAVDAATVILKLGEKEITKSEVQDATQNVLAEYYQYYAMLYGQQVDLTDKSLVASAQSEAITRLKQDMVLRAKAAELGLDQLTDEETAQAKEAAENDLENAKSYIRDYYLTEDQKALEGEELEAAIQVLRKSTNLGGLITMYVKDTSDTANVTVSGFTADAGMGVVAVDATVTIQGQAAEARILP